jgi:hypothetical protein
MKNKHEFAADLFLEMATAQDKLGSRLISNKFGGSNPFLGKEFMKASAGVLEALPPFETRSIDLVPTALAKLGVDYLRFVDIPWDQFLIISGKGFPLIWVANKALVETWNGFQPRESRLDDMQSTQLIQNSQNLWNSTVSKVSRRDQDISDMLNRLVDISKTADRDIAVPFAFAVLERLTHTVLHDHNRYQESRLQPDFTPRLQGVVADGIDVDAASAKALRLASIMAGIVGVYRSVGLTPFTLRFPTTKTVYEHRRVDWITRNGVVHNLQVEYLTDEFLAAAMSLSISLAHEHYCH